MNLLSLLILSVFPAVVSSLWCGGGGENINGSCVCHPGFKGTYCQTINCADSRGLYSLPRKICNDAAKSFCKHGTFLWKISHCSCDSGWVGKKCDNMRESLIQRIVRSWSLAFVLALFVMSIPIQLGVVISYLRLRNRAIASRSVAYQRIPEHRVFILPAHMADTAGTGPMRIGLIHL